MVRKGSRKQPPKKGGPSGKEALQHREDIRGILRRGFAGLRGILLNNAPCFRFSVKNQCVQYIEFGIPR